MNKIDFVLPWVNSNDPLWQEERTMYNLEHNTEDKHTQTRFRDMHTLKYVLRSIEKYCPWYHKIYLITTGHYPEWLNIAHPKIELITHQELFINKSALPVFNSNAIEMNLVNIPNLSENFVYLNDDMVIWQPLDIERFFKNNKPVDFFSHSWIPRNKFYQMIRGKDTWIDSLNNNIVLINEKIIKNFMEQEHLFHKSYSIKQKINNFIYRYIYKKVIWINHWHHPQAYSKSTLQAVYKEYQQDMIETSNHKFRSSSDITPYLYRYWHLVQGEFEPGFYNDAIVAKISSLKYLQSIITNINQNKIINFVCFNDQMNQDNRDEFNQIVNTLTNYLEKKFPKKQTFEL